MAFNSPRVRFALDLITTLVILATCAVLVLKALHHGPNPPPTPAVPTEPIDISDAPIKGDPNAPVAIIEFSDFQCPFCARFVRDTLPALEANYIRTGQAFLVFRHLPLEKLHPRAMPAAKAAACAGEQGRFWEMHDALFGGQAHLDDTSLTVRARTIGLDERPFAACLAGSDAAIKQDAALAASLRLTSTPTFLVGTVEADGRMKARAILNGARPAGDFATAVENAATPTRRIRLGLMLASGVILAGMLAGTVTAALRRRSRRAPSAVAQ